MATYKVIQDIEAEDKLVGPLSLRQFIYAAIVAVSGFIAFKLASVAIWLVIPFLPHMILFGLLASPFGHDQPSEVWLLAKVQYYLKPRRRIWNQTGMTDLVTITAPKVVERQLTNDLSQTEVKSRLNALASTLDSRGWAIKNVNVNLYAAPDYGQQMSDRLVAPGSLPQDVPDYQIQAADDILDERNNPVAQHLSQMVDQSMAAHHQQLMDIAQRKIPPPSTTGQPTDYWFLNQTAGQAPPAPAGLTTFPGATLAVTPGTAAAPSTPAALTDTELAALNKIHADKEKPDPTKGHHRQLQPMGSHKAPAKHHTAEPQAAAPALNPAVAELARNDDLNVATIARQANKPPSAPPPADNEVVISLR